MRHREQHLQSSREMHSLYHHQLTFTPPKFIPHKVTGFKAVTEQRTVLPKPFQLDLVLLQSKGFTQKLHTEEGHRNYTLLGDALQTPLSPSNNPEEMLQSHPNPKDSISAFPGRTSHNCTPKESAGIPFGSTKDPDLSSLLELLQCCHKDRTAQTRRKLCPALEQQEWDN